MGPTWRDEGWRRGQATNNKQQGERMDKVVMVRTTGLRKVRAGVIGVGRLTCGELVDGLVSGEVGRFVCV